MSADYDALIAETYDAQYRQIRDPSGDRAFYAGLARDGGGPVLELGCGTGRVLLPIARDGIECVGLDPSEAMLERLRAKGPPDTLTLVRGRMEALDLDRRDFALCFAGFRAFMHVETVEGQLETLRRVRAHLRPGGRFALDVFEPDLARMAVRVEEREQPPFEHDGCRILRSFRVERDHAAQLQQVWFHYTDADTGEALGTERVAMRWIYRYELEHLLVRSGFTPVRWLGGFDGRPYDASGEIIVVAERVDRGAPRA